MFRIAPGCITAGFKHRHWTFRLKNKTSVYVFNLFWLDDRLVIESWRALKCFYNDYSKYISKNWYVPTAITTHPLSPYFLDLITSQPYLQSGETDNWNKTTFSYNLTFTEYCVHYFPPGVFFFACAVKFKHPRKLKCPIRFWFPSNLYENVF